MSSKTSTARIHAQNDIMNKFRMRGVETGVTYSITDLIDAMPGINHRTVRRAVHDLVSQGNLYEVGRKQNAILYGTDAAVKMNGKASVITHVFDGDQVDFPTFVMRLLNLSEDAFECGHTKDGILRDDVPNAIRKLVAMGIIANESEHLAATKFLAKSKITNVRQELQGLLRVVLALENSAIFKPHQQEMMHSEINELIKKHPNLYTTLKELAS